MNPSQVFLRRDVLQLCFDCGVHHHGQCSFLQFEPVRLCDCWYSYIDCGDGAIDFPVQQNVDVVRGLSDDVQGKILRTQ